jgi:hypothetical protein
MGFVQRQLRDLEQRKQSISEKRLRLEMEQLSECTFQPATNSNAEGPDGDGDPLHALYRDAGEMTRAKRLEGEHALSVQREMHELSLCTFVPQINEGRKRGRGATGENVFRRLSAGHEPKVHVRSAECHNVRRNEAQQLSEKQLESFIQRQEGDMRNRKSKLERHRAELVPNHRPDIRASQRGVSAREARSSLQKIAERQRQEPQNKKSGTKMSVQQLESFIERQRLDMQQREMKLGQQRAQQEPTYAPDIRVSQQHVHAPISAGLVQQLGCRISSRPSRVAWNEVAHPEHCPEGKANSCTNRSCSEPIHVTHDAGLQLQQAILERLAVVATELVSDSTDDV